MLSVMAQRELILAGERVALSPMREEDQASFLTWIAEQPELRRMIGDDSVPTEEGQAAWFRRSMEPDRRLVSIVTFPEGRLIGNGGYVALDPDLQEAEFRITLGDSAIHGKGYGSEATRLLLKYGFQELGLKRIHLRVLPFNERARRMYRSAGLRELPEDGSPRGIPMEISAEEYAKLPRP